MSRRDDTTEGTDPGRAVIVAVDPSFRVRQVEVRSLQPLRTPAALRQVFEAAYRDALARRVRRPDDATARKGRPVARRARRVRPTPTAERLGRHQTRYRGADLPRPRRSGEVTGESVNACVRVTLPLANARGTLDADPGWLAIATRARLGAAITEAFTDAYARRDHP